MNARLTLSSAFVLLIANTPLSSAQSSDSPSVRAHSAIEMVKQGRCEESLPKLERVIPQLTDKQLRYASQMAEVRCAMALDRQTTALQALTQLKHEFPDDPETFFISVHYFSQLAQRNAQELAAKAPASVQARRLEAENFESQGKWDEAAGMYQGILKEAAQTPGIHYRLGQVLLAKAGDSGPVDEARSEFQQELAVDPQNASAEFVLGELARRSGQWDEAAQHFGRASTLDVGFSEAYLAHGMALVLAGKFNEAVPALERYVKMQPSDPSGHYQLALAYGRTGNREGAQREMTLKNQTAERASHDSSATAAHPVQ